MTFDTAIASLKQGEFVMVYDSDGRESEVDMMVAAEFCTPEHVARMRQHAGGLLCLAISNDLTKKLDLEYMHNILANSNDLDIDSKNMIMGTAPYGDHPTFSISVNQNRIAVAPSIFVVTTSSHKNFPCFKSFSSTSFFACWIFSTLLSTPTAFFT